MIKAGGPLLEERNDEDDLKVAGDFPENLCRGAGNGFGQVEEGRVLRFAEIFAGMQLLQDDQLGAAASGIANAGEAFIDVSSAVSGAALLDQSGLYLAHVTTPRGICIVTQCREPC